MTARRVVPAASALWRWTTKARVAPSRRSTGRTLGAAACVSPRPKTVAAAVAAAAAEAVAVATGEAAVAVAATAAAAAVAATGSRNVCPGCSLRQPGPSFLDGPLLDGPARRH